MTPDATPDAHATRLALFAKVENLLRTSGHAGLADQLVDLGDLVLSPHGLVEALRGHASSLRAMGCTGTGSSLEDLAARIAAGQTVRNALLCAWRCARAGAW